MTKPEYHRERVLVWGKTYPELSTKYTETVCTGAVRMSDGSPIRLYPVPLRYMDTRKQYALYDVIDVDVIKSDRDTRAESFKVDRDSLVRVDHLETDAQEWAERRRVILRNPDWQFASVGALLAAHEQGTHSMGIVTPGEVLACEARRKPPAAAAEYAAKWDLVTSQHDFFPIEYRELEFLPYQIRLKWRCSDTAGCTCRRNPHDACVLDWGLLELGRKTGDWEKARAKLATISHLETHDFRLFMGNMWSHPRSFSIIGLWYPIRRDQSVLL